MSSINNDIPTAVVVNDDNTQRRIQAGLLHKAGITANAFDSVRAALSAMSGQPPPDIIITDLYMPGIDGWKFCRLLRSPEYPVYNPIPILVVSATFAGDEAGRITADLGANAFLSSPVDGTRFIQTVQLLLAGGRPKDRLQVLIVEDSRTQAAIIKNAFEQNGYHAFVAPDLASAVEACKTRFFDLAVVDFHLPDGKGDVLLTGLRKMLPDLVCIMMTTDPDPDLAVAWMQKGAAAYLRKPFETDYLLELCIRARRERALLRVEDLLEKRTRELSESKRQYQTLVENLNEVIYRLDDQANITYVSPSIEVQAGYAPDEIIGRNFIEFVHPEDIDGRIDQYQKIMSGIVETSEYRFLAKNGQSVWISTCARPIIREEKIVGIQGVLTNITELKQAETKIRQLRKTESLGRMAGAIAHHYNNLLMGVLGNLELAMLALPEGSAAAENLTQAIAAARRAADMGTDMLNYLGNTRAPRTILNVTNTCQHFLHDIEKTIPAHVSLNTDFPQPGYTVSANIEQIRHLLETLVGNAVEAMENHSGAVTISIRKVGPENIPSLHRYPVDCVPAELDYVCLAVLDTGEGIQDNDIEKIFDPFYSTRSIGRGLGLSMALGSVKAHNGFMSVESPPERGTLFQIFLPLAGKTEIKNDGSTSEKQMIVKV
ncbi:MAG TPA: response regulator [Desulfotignum sp.]|nr:response regulator [Desulfotignum sp.]